MTGEEARRLLNGDTKSESLVKHALAVEAGTRHCARRFGADARTGGVVGSTIAKSDPNGLSYASLKEWCMRNSAPVLQYRQSCPHLVPVLTAKEQRPFRSNSGVRVMPVFNLVIWILMCCLSDSRSVVLSRCVGGPVTNISRQSRKWRWS